MIIENHLNNLKEIKKQWQEFLPRFTNKELLKIFPETKEIIFEKLKESEKENIEVIEIIKKKLTTIKNKTTDEFSKWFWQEWIKINEGQEFLEVDEKMARFKRLAYVAKGKKLKGIITDEMIQQALLIPIESIINQHIRLRKSGKNLIGLCPFHNEKYPSFFIYPETNSFYCFGCQKGGNVINLIRILYGYSFKDAVKYLMGKN